MEFRHFDKDGSGDIDFDEFHHVVVDHYNIDLPVKKFAQCSWSLLSEERHSGRAAKLNAEIGEATRA